MEKQAFLLLLDDLIEEAPGFLNGEEGLSTLDGWDSFATLGFISLIDKNFGITLAGERIANCTTVADLLDLVADQLS